MGVNAVQWRAVVRRILVSGLDVARLAVSLLACVGVFVGAAHLAQHDPIHAAEHGKVPCEICLSSGSPAIVDAAGDRLPTPSPLAPANLGATKECGRQIEAVWTQRSRGPPQPLFL